MLLHPAGQLSACVGVGMTCMPGPLKRAVPSNKMCSPCSPSGYHRNAFRLCRPVWPDAQYAAMRCCRGSGCQPIATHRHMGRTAGHVLPLYAWEAGLHSPFPWSRNPAPPAMHTPSCSCVSIPGSPTLHAGHRRITITLGDCTHTAQQQKQHDSGTPASSVEKLARQDVQRHSGHLIQEHCA